MSSQKLNRLAQASSPYLQQHANNPVDWYEWGEEAIEKARKEDKPLLISIGYSACHWCHVMERESYMDEEVAEYMNAHFVAVKVDREERPDIDQIYIDAAQLLNGQAGWPLNAFALPDGQPFWVGVYFPKDNWLNVLEQLHKVYTDEREKVKKQAEALTEGVNQEFLVDLKAEPSVDFTKQNYVNLIDPWLEKIDFEKGGFESPQKFPMTSGWEFLLQYAYLTENNQVLEAVNTTLKEMAYGGIFDQLGGGFARYATDEEWFAPHFEKMLYDNAQLVSLYAHAFQYTKNHLYRNIVEETLAFVDRELTAENGGFYSALNADSEGEEGKFMVWKSFEIDKILNRKESELFKAFYNVTAIGNWEEGKNILHRKQSLKKFAESRGLPVEEAKAQLNSAKKKMMKSRDQRIRPSTDDKILTSWNALMIKAYVEAYFSLGSQNYLDEALKHAEFITEKMQMQDGGVFRNYKDETASISGFLDDYASLAEALIMLYQASLDKEWLLKAKNLADYAIEHFQDLESGLFYYTSDKAEGLISRKMELTDNEMPSSNAVMAKVLFEMGNYFQEENYLDISQRMLKKLRKTIEKGAPYFGKWTFVLGEMSFNPYEIVVMGDAAKDIILELNKEYLPTSLIMGGETENLPLLENKLVQGKTMIYVCQNKTCKKPVETSGEALEQLQNE